MIVQRGQQLYQRVVPIPAWRYNPMVERKPRAKPHDTHARNVRHCSAAGSGDNASPHHRPGGPTRQRASSRSSISPAVSAPVELATTI